MPTNKHWIKTLYHSILPNRVRCGSRDEFRAFKDSSEIGMKPRLTQTLIDYHPSAPNFSAIRTKSAREEAFVLSHHVAALNFDGGLPRAEFARSDAEIGDSQIRRRPSPYHPIETPRSSISNFRNGTCCSMPALSYVPRRRVILIEIDRGSGGALSPLMRQVTLGYQARLNGIMATLGMNGLCPQQNGFRLLHTLGTSNRRRD